MSATTPAVPAIDLPAAALRQFTVERLLCAEAEALDEWRLRDWLAMLTDDIVYQVPIRIHKEVTDDNRVTGVMTNSFHMDEDRISLEMRVERIETGFAWAEEPPTRTRHLVANVRVGEPDADGTLPVRSNLLLYHTRWDRPEYTILSGERRDLLRPDPDARDGERWLIARRLVVLDNTVIPTHNMSFFL